MTWLASMAVLRLRRRGVGAAETDPEDRRHPPSLLLLDQERRRRPARIRGAIDPAGRDRRRRLSAAPGRHQEARRSRRDRHQRDRPRRFHPDDAQGLGQQEDRHHPSQRDDAADSCRPRNQRQLAHVHLVHQRHPTDLRDPEGDRAPCVRRTRPPCNATPASTPGDCGSSSRRRRSSWRKRRSRAS